MLTPTPRRRSDGAKPAQAAKIQAVSQEAMENLDRHEKAPKGTKSSGMPSSAPASAPITGHELRVTNNVGAHAPEPMDNGDHSAAAGLVVAANRPADVVAFEQQVVGFFVDAADLLGVPKSVAAIYGICFASPEPLSFSDIDERLDISSGSISQGLRVLKEVGALKVAEDDGVGRSTQSQEADSQLSALSSQPSSTAGNGENGADEAETTQSLSPSLLHSLGRRRADRYEPDLELRKLILRWLENRLQNELKSGQSRLKTIMASIPATLDAPDSVLRTRFDSLSTWHGKAASLLPIVKGMLKLT